MEINLCFSSLQNLISVSISHQLLSPTRFCTEAIMDLPAGVSVVHADQHRWICYYGYRTKHTFGEPVESFRFENDGAPSKLKPLALTINFLMEIGCWKPGQPGSALPFVPFCTRGQAGPFPEKVQTTQSGVKGTAAQNCASLALRRASMEDHRSGPSIQEV